jgi:hypothetical protein
MLGRDGVRLLDHLLVGIAHDDLAVFRTFRTAASATSVPIPFFKTLIMSAPILLTARLKFALYESHIHSSRSLEHASLGTRPDRQGA